PPWRITNSTRMSPESLGERRAGIGGELRLAPLEVDPEAVPVLRARGDVRPDREDARRLLREPAAVEAAGLAEEHRPCRPGQGDAVLRRRRRRHLLVGRLRLAVRPRPQVTPA